MFSQLFGKYLVEKEIIKNEEYLAAVEKQLTVRVKLGTIAIAEGLFRFLRRRDPRRIY